ncbi:MAG: palindromic element RPE4 domain-containing protein [Gammaproteobacteria bacterium]|nr:palindromic element RPE4 domain-containing protein [Gammaproteobacteria bacterium]
MESITRHRTIFYSVIPDLIRDPETINYFLDTVVKPRYDNAGFIRIGALIS